MQMTLYTINEVATLFKVHPDTISKLIKDKHLAASKIRGQWRISAEAISDYLDSRTVKVIKRKQATI